MKKSGLETLPTRAILTIEFQWNLYDVKELCFFTQCIILCYIISIKEYTINEVTGSSSRNSLRLLYSQCRTDLIM